MQKGEREFEMFCRAVDEFQCRADQDEFDQIVTLLATKIHTQPPPALAQPDVEPKSAKVFPVRGDECYARTELLVDASGYSALWPSDATPCKHQPIKSCPSIWAAFARAHNQSRGKS